MCFVKEGSEGEKKGKGEKRRKGSGEIVLLFNEERNPINHNLIIQIWPEMNFTLWTR